MIPVNEPVIGQAEADYVRDCVETGWISSAGSYIQRFEESWAAYCGMAHGIAVSNGTAALQIAVGCLNLQPGDEVIMPSFTIVSCAQAITYNGATPVLVDCEADTWCLDIDQVEAKIGPRTKAIMPVHMYGHPADMGRLRELADKHGLAIVEDAAQAHGAEYRGRKCGGLGDLSCFSFYGNKIITTGEGGMVLTNDDAYAEHARKLRNLCFEADRRFYHRELGFNYRMTNIQAAIGLGQVERIDEFVAKKRAMGAYYNAGFADVAGISIPVERDWAKSVYWMYGLVLDESTGHDAESFAAELKSRGIDTRPYFVGMHEQPVFHDMGLFKDESYPVTDRIARQGLYVPSGLSLTQAEQDDVIAAVKEVLGA